MDPKVEDYNWMDKLNQMRDESYSRMDEYGSIWMRKLGQHAGPGSWPEWRMCLPLSTL
jgi:GH25 family lysozyme M1 (1,4-beta-N-acetylmuramidase)